LGGELAYPLSLGQSLFYPCPTHWNTLLYLVYLDLFVGSAIFSDCVATLEARLTALEFVLACFYHHGGATYSVQHHYY
jgi:hypothetical protein